jgi:hypothetical protein
VILRKGIIYITKNNLRREVSYEEAIEFMKINGIDLFFETSSKENLNVEEVRFFNR